MKRLLALLLVFTMVFSITACSSEDKDVAENQEPVSNDGAKGSEAEADDSGEEVKVVRIGAVFPFSGGSAAMGNLQRAGIEMAVDNYNAAGGIKSMGGAKIEMVWGDSTGLPEVGVTEIERLIVNEKVDCLLGPYNSSVGASTAPVAERYGVPYLLTNSNVDSILENGYKYVFRANHANSDAAGNMVDFLAGVGDETGAKVKTVAIVNENSDWGVGMAEVLATLSEEAGFEVVASENFSTNAADLSNIVIKLKDLQPDVVFAMCYLNDALLLTNQMQEYGVKSAIFADGGGFVVPDYLNVVGAGGEGVLATSGWHTGIIKYKGEVANELNEQYKKDYSSGVDFDEFSASGWLNASVMINALERAGSTDKEAIRDALAATDIKPDDYELSLHAFEGIKFGDVKNMTNQNIYSGKVIIQAIDGKMTLVGPLEMVTDSEYKWPIEK